MYGSQGECKLLLSHWFGLFFQALKVLQFAEVINPVSRSTLAIELSRSNGRHLRDLPLAIDSSEKTRHVWFNRYLRLDDRRILTIN